MMAFWILQISKQADGNFKALLSFRVDAGDDILAHHLKTAASNATYISKTTQNEIINCVAIS
jgi:hypothetical protein